MHKLISMSALVTNYFHVIYMHFLSFLFLLQALKHHNHLLQFAKELKVLPSKVSDRCINLENCISILSYLKWQ